MQQQTRQRVLLLREDITGVDSAKVRHRLRLYKHYGCVLRKDTTGVDTARIRRRLRLCEHYGAYYGKTRQASTPRGSDADLDYKNTEVEFPESLAAADINL